MTTLSRSVAGRVALVTGASGGMGRATAEVFAAEGARVAVTDFDGAGAQAVADSLAGQGLDVRAWRMDVSDAAEIRRVVAEIATRFGGLDIVVNNAGVSAFAR